MRKDTKIGIIGIACFVIGALMVGKSIDVRNSLQTIGLIIMICGIYIIGYYIAMKKE